MNPNLPLHLLAFLTLIPGWLSAQTGTGTWTWTGDVSARMGREWNVFHSPTSYLDAAGVARPLDSLIRPDVLFEPALALDAERKGEQGLWRIHVDGEVRRYSNWADANRHGVQLRAGRDHNLASGLTGRMDVRLREEQRLGLNILGDELLTSFSFLQTQCDLGLGWQVNEALQLDAGVEVYRKDYDDRTTGESLDHLDRSIETGFVWIPSRSERGTRGLELVGRKRKRSGIRWSGGYEYRDKRYDDRINTDLLNPDAGPLDPTPFLPYDPALAGTYPLRWWTYSTWRLRCDLPVREGWRLRVDTRRQNREDRSRGDFGYRDFKTTARLGWSPTGPWSLSLSASRTWRNYTDRLAEQADGVPYPTLNYRYNRLDGLVTYRTGKRSSLIAVVDLTARETNTTAVDRRTRREYRTGSVLVGWRMGFGQ